MIRANDAERGLAPKVPFPVFLFLRVPFLVPVFISHHLRKKMGQVPLEPIPVKMRDTDIQGLHTSDSRFRPTNW